MGDRETEAVKEETNETEGEELLEKESWTRESALARDREALENVIHRHHIRSWAEDFCILISHKTVYRRLTITLRFLPEYPSTPAHIELSSEHLPPKLLDKLTKLAEGEIESKGLKGKPHVSHVYSYLDEIIHENKLLYATPEVRRCVALSKEKPEFTVLANEKEGRLTIKAGCGQYTMKAIITVPDNYPSEKIGVDISRCTFPESVWHTYLLQAREIARKCELGVKAEEAVRQSTTATGARVAQTVEKERETHITSASLHSMKDDIKFLKQASDLRTVNSSYNKMLHQFEYSTQVRRAARRELRKKTKAEEMKEREEERQAAEAAELAQMKEWRRVMGMSEEGPQRSIKVVVEFLTRGFLFRLPLEKSPISGKPVFPSDPTVLKEWIDKRKKTRPVRVPTCGCWFIYSELDKFITEPPFAKPCPREACQGIVVQHPDWPDDVKRLEKAWAMKKAREREIAEVSDMFGLDDDFHKPTKKRD